ncbi:hypothetical protein PoB_005651600 [Plakobranchus ocellatus]|uniref:Uncharacterized protein n=1 Tax=Plakobranchus ocellatus TaxID=259542 RepID=A0AAV4C3U3_9GAST|nr:hypothetical protein PoB_005651600 [Plakobranchus ocellatus]
MSSDRITTDDVSEGSRFDYDDYQQSEGSGGSLVGQLATKSEVQVHKVISDFTALRQAGAPMAGLEPATEGSLQISGRSH